MTHEKPVDLEERKANERASTRRNKKMRLKKLETNF